MKRIRAAFGTRTFFVLSIAGIAAVAYAVAMGMPVGSSGGTTPSASAQENSCPRPVDLAIVFDHTGSMDDVANKIENAKAASVSFVNEFAGGPADPDLSPHSMSLTGFFNGTAVVDVTQGTNAAEMRTDINGYSTLGRTHIGRGLFLGQQQLSASGPASNYMVLLSDGAANVPEDVDDANTGDLNNDIYLDVNDNGIVDNGDDLSVDYGPDGAADFVVVNGLLQISSEATRRQALNADDASEGSLTDGDLGNGDDYDFGPGINFRIVNATLVLDANGDGTFSAPNLTHTAGHTDELVVERDGDVWGGSTNFSGDGSDVYAQYWATQLKTTGTFLYVISAMTSGPSRTQRCCRPWLRRAATSPAARTTSAASSRTSLRTSARWASRRRAPATPK